MIDWVSAELPCAHLPLNAGSVMKVGGDGSVEWMAPCRLSIAGTYEASIQVRSVGGDGQGGATALYISGNPSKFLQGHNIFGSDDLVALMYDTYLRITEFLDLKPTLFELERVKRGAYPVTTVDINYSYELPSRADVQAWIRAAEFKSKTRHGRPSMKGGTLYWGKSSRRWALKVYSKGEEIEAGKKHQLPDPLKETKLSDWADNKLRVELRLKSNELAELGLRQANQFDVKNVRDLYFTYVRKLEMSEQIALSDQLQNELPQRLRSTYVLWRSGEDLRSTLPKTTYYRHRKEFLAYGIDIALRQESIDHSNVIPLVRVLEAVPATVPEWAFEQALVHPSAAGNRAC